MEFVIIEEELKRIFPYLSDINYDGIIVKKLEATNTWDDNRTTKQTHIAITGKQMDFFPYLLSSGYFDCDYDDKDDLLKKYYVTMIPIVLHKDNLSYLGMDISNIDNFLTQSSIVRSRRKDAADQIQFALPTYDDDLFIRFRELLHTGYYLILLKRENEFKYDVVALKSTDSSSLIQEANGHFYKSPTSTKIDISKYIKIQKTSEISINDLADILKYSYKNAGDKQLVASIHVFGMKYGKIISEKDYNVAEIVKLAGLKPSYETEVSKGIRIYKYLNENFSLLNENFDESSSNTYASNFDQIIYYGVPGSGKSHTIDEEVKGVPDDQKMRVVFHPEYSNADFVGQILPKIDDGVDYRFKAGPFSRILKKALKNPDKPYYLIIEEINRGNAAAIFGELFQLLDRNKNGWSQYVIDNIDINAFIRSDDDTYTDKNSEIKSEVEFGGLKFNANSGIKLPPNLSILATMNTSDQNVFTLDNAFQRRWEMILVENIFKNTPEEIAQKEALIADSKVTWGKFQEHINALIGEKTTSIGMSSMEDKRLGCWFVKAENGKISKDVFAEKVLKYLWDDAFKFCRDEVFNIENKNTTLESIISRFKSEDADKCWNIFKDISFVGIATEKNAD